MANKHINAVLNATKNAATKTINTQIKETEKDINSVSKIITDVKDAAVKYTSASTVTSDESAFVKRESEDKAGTGRVSNIALAAEKYWNNTDSSKVQADNQLANEYLAKANQKIADYSASLFDKMKDGLDIDNSNSKLAQNLGKIMDKWGGEVAKKGQQFLAGQATSVFTSPLGQEVLKGVTNYKNADAALKNLDKSTKAASAALSSENLKAQSQMLYELQKTLVNDGLDKINNMWVVKRDRLYQMPKSIPFDVADRFTYWYTTYHFMVTKVLDEYLAGIDLDKIKKEKEEKNKEKKINKTIAYITYYMGKMNGIVNDGVSMMNKISNYMTAYITEGPEFVANKMNYYQKQGLRIVNNTMEDAYQGIVAFKDETINQAAMESAYAIVKDECDYLEEQLQDMSDEQRVKCAKIRKIADAQIKEALNNIKILLGR